MTISTNRGQTEQSEATVERLIRAAYDCFQKFGIKKTTIEDIADRAKVTRPTVYRYFQGKDDLIRHLCELEVLKVNREVKARIGKRKEFAERLTEALLVTVRVASKNRFVRIIIESPSHLSRSADPGSPDYFANRSVWGPTLDHGIAQGHLAGDLSVDTIASWLTLSESMLLIKVDSKSFSDEELREFIRRFVVDPILPKSLKV
tara:strand:- start:346 stop:957 length:612 start_codon:yes stop_codon:yes gene_type:complete